MTRMSITPTIELIDVTAFNDGRRVSVPGLSLISFELSGVMEPAPGALDTLQGWMQNGFGPSYQQEYMCLYCASPNPVANPHCSQCGAPRSFVIG